MSAAAQIDWLPVESIGELQAHIDEDWRRGHILAHDGQLFRWQHRFPENPERLSVLVARAGGRIVGSLGVIAVPFCVRGHRTSGGWLTTWIATPVARKQQVGLHLLRRVLEEPFGFVGTTAANETALRIYRALGFSIHPSIPRWVRIVSSDALATLLGERAPPPSGGPPVRSPTRSSLRISSWSEACAERWDELWECRLAPRLVGTWRDAAYLRWRYLEHPRFAYAVRVAEDAGGSLRGLAVHRIADIRGARGRVVRIVELLGDSPAATALACDVIAAGARAGAAFAEFYCTAGALAEPLEACGFTCESEPTETLPALFEPLNFEIPPRLTGAFRAGAGLGGNRALFESDALYVTRSDGDGDRPHELT
jgi:hypothetical protein